jgi:hypothetical protein
MSALAPTPPALGLVGHHTDCGVEKERLGVVVGPSQANQSRHLRAEDGLTTSHWQPFPPRKH